MSPSERKIENFIEFIYNALTNCEDFEKKDILQILEEVRIMVLVQRDVTL